MTPRKRGRDRRPESPRKDDAKEQPAPVQEERKEKETGSWWHRLTMDGKVLTIIGVITGVAATLAIPGVAEWLHIKTEPKIEAPIRQAASPPATSQEKTARELDQSESPKVVTPSKPKLKFVPLPNAPDPELVPPPSMASSRTPLMMPDIKGLPPTLNEHPFERVAFTPAFVDPSVAQEHLSEQINPTMFALPHNSELGVGMKSMTKNHVEDDGYDAPTKVRILIGTDGMVQSAEVLQPTPIAQMNRHQLEQDASVIAAVKQWRYKPFLVDGKPAVVTTDVVVKWNIQIITSKDMKKATKK